MSWLNFGEKKLFSEALKSAKANLVCQNNKNDILVIKKSTETIGEANGLITFITPRFYGRKF